MSKFSEQLDQILLSEGDASVWNRLQNQGKWINRDPEAFDETMNKLQSFGPAIYDKLKGKILDDWKLLEFNEFAVGHGFDIKFNYKQLLSSHAYIKMTPVEGGIALTIQREYYVPPEKRSLSVGTHTRTLCDLVDESILELGDMATEHAADLLLRLIVEIYNIN